MKKKITFIGLILVLSVFMTQSCRKDLPSLDRTANGLVVSRSYNWKTPQYSGGPSMTGSYFKSPIYYNGNIAVPTIGEGKQYMTLLDSDNGNILWKWSDLFQPDTEQIDIYYYYQQGNLLTYQKGKRSYCINMDTGATQWKFRRDMFFDVRIQKENDNYISYAPIINIDGNSEQVAFKGNINTGEISSFLSANISSSYISPIGVGGIVYLNQLPDQEDLLLITYAEPLPDWKVNSFFGLYNRQTDTWIWDRKLISPPTVNSSVFTPPQFCDNKIVANVGKKLVCHDIATGEQLWSRSFAQDFMFSGFVIAEGKIVANCEDGYTYGIDPATGTILWQTRSAGTSGRMSYLNGVVYFVGGSTGKLHAIDVASGRMLWAIDATNLGEGDDDFRENGVYILPASSEHSARVVALTYKNAYCFDAER